MKIGHFCSSLLMALFLLLPAQEACAEETGPPPWSVFAYGGQWTDTRFVHIAFRGRTDFQNAYIWVAGVSRSVYDVSRHFGTEGEFNVAGHSGRQNHFEMNTAFLVRWRTFPWDQYVNTSIAYGLGLSYAAERPPIEEEPHRRATRLLLSMPAELTFGPPTYKNSPWEAMVRIHHRSGAFGIFKDAGGSNFLSTGVRYRF